MDGVLFSTTNSIAGYKVVKHVGVITEHVVVGADFITNFFASFTDIVGGRSNTMESCIWNLKDDLYDQMTKTARLANANALLGIHVDFDEISGKNTQLFMVTGYATAVVVESTTSSETAATGIIDGKRLSRLLSINKLKDAISSCQAELKQANNISSPSKIAELINSAVQLRADELATSLFELPFVALMSYGNLPYINDALRIISISLIPCLSEHQPYECLMHILCPVAQEPNYALMKHILPQHCEETANVLKTFVASFPVNYQQLSLLAQSLPCYLWSVFLIPLVLKIKQNYTAEDIEYISALSLALTEGITHPTYECKIEKTDGLLGKETWTCPCGSILPLKKEICLNCSRDIHGVSDALRHEVSDAVAHLSLVIDGLKKLLNQ